MKTSDFFYDLPPERIAQHPAEPRDSSRLMVLRRGDAAIAHDIFHNIADYLQPGDCLILNDTRVLPARLYGIKERTGARVEFLLLRQRAEQQWICLAGPGKKAKPGDVFLFGDALRGTVTDVLPDGGRVVQFACQSSFFAALEQIGEMPLPHYITERLTDPARYQTVYARESGSSAAPTAGLHFTPELLGALRAKGVRIGFVTLHVGLGTFRPVKTARVEDHVMHSEHYSIPAETAVLVNETKAAGGRVFVAGTTCCRALESAKRARGDSPLCACEAWTDIFLYPGCVFKCVDALLTNFHLPESTLIMLVSAFYGREKTLAAYNCAVREGYRFYSFGDAMLIL
ncbi:MAG: tRNA preQ1(34) S-adenosylmethionine ribosyltransferase-isomerase QueA [Oscillospiraceae bacterium]|jgi:S-adenosylmethionine:tRNA ribosyltransferase-isomerase|nr:tRNA preQ1(34) S-adenosylmethionine ribosyltransferase-isomerase QueA [Oscillospiraceae bacterium]